MKKLTKGLVIALSLSLAFTMVGCSSESNAPKEPAQQTDKAPAEEPKAPADAEKAPADAEKAPAEAEKAPANSEKAPEGDAKAPAKAPAKGPALEEESCDC